MDFYQSAGSLVIGSRLKRLGEKFLQEVSKVYVRQGIDFDPAWFPFFYLLDQNKTMSLREISDQLGVSHSAVSQLATALIKKGHLQMEKCEIDRRRRIIQLTDQGNALLQKSKPIWKALQETMKEVSELGDQQLLKELTVLENSLKEENLSDRVISKL
ncbi:MarR family transcriptional regulator [Flammeovirga yaeyamensis]|uniref:MarR family transcriptional regulator n=1 Tax=Flammeovirga yaeyamensis TaxID=367791 RepID=A0AAX1N839_9BACT|nr:MarR family transcriptional regulator [Flammeovirga yaeyamensis]MBB3698873.1 DNA-binding MarR family transcriptional regulator [Flammeovirga yaeyamensis]NMF37458.1 MarR family transcriptional regulator [Flammeovirga yaeyamensis]QWG03729.1 MarR family transcriptional regulator [Flammeovirga yaeyamensis]